LVACATPDYNEWSMRLALLAPLTLAILLSAGCGARTGEDELMTPDLGAGGTASGGTDGGGGIFGTGGVPDPDACCHPSAGRGCDDEVIEACVCAEDSFCCSGAWDNDCVALVEEFGCGSCGVGTGGTGSGGSGGGPPVGDCCSSHTDPGCSQADIQDCVCAFDIYCCETAWDPTCVSEVAQCNASCETGTGGQSAGGAGGQDTGGQSAGGQAAGGVGGLNTGGQSAGGQSAGGQSAGGSTGGQNTGGQNTGGQNTGGQNTGGQAAGGGGGASGNCCEVHDTIACEDPGVTDCVCMADPFCCNNHWDEWCVQRADEQCGASCGNPYCEGIPAGTCEDCMCNECFNPVLNCINEPACSCVISTGCVSDCLDPDVCGSVLNSGNWLETAGLVTSVQACQESSGCPCY